MVSFVDDLPRFNQKALFVYYRGFSHLHVLCFISLNEWDFSNYDGTILSFRCPSIVRGLFSVNLWCFVLPYLFHKQFNSTNILNLRNRDSC